MKKPAITFLLTLPLAMLAQDAINAAGTVTIEHLLDSGLTSAMIAALAAATAWLAAKRRFGKVDAKVDVKRQPPLAEDVARRFVTKDEFTRRDDENREEFRRLYDKIDKSNDDNSKWREGTARQLGSIESLVRQLHSRNIGGNAP